jgi:DDE superfamily endonuclease
VTVPCCDSDSPAMRLVAVRLDLPKIWAHTPKRRRPAGVTEKVPFQTTPESALTLLEQARPWGDRLDA